MEHKTGATDVLLRYEEGGGFMMAGYAASQAPIFTLYGDGTVIFRNPMLDVPPAQGSTMTFNPLRTAKLSEEQIGELLTLALGEGGLAAARPKYDNMMVSDASTAVFTIDAGGIKKAVSIYALGMEPQAGDPDTIAKTAFKKLADRLADFDQGGSITTAVYEPEAYRASIIESPGMVAPDMIDWPWADLTVADFKSDADPNGLSFPHHTLTTDEVAKLGVKDFEGGFNGLVLARIGRQALHLGASPPPRRRQGRLGADTHSQASHEAGPVTGRPRGMMAAPDRDRCDLGGATVGVIIIREMVGTSPRSWSDAARQAVATASKTVRNIQTVEVVKSSAVVEDGEIVEYRVELKIGFEYEG